MVLPNDNVFGKLCIFFRNIFLQNILKKKPQCSAKAHLYSQWWRFWGTLLGFFRIFFSKISQSHSGISQFLFQPNAHKNMFSFELPTVAASHSFFHKVAQRSAMQRKFLFPPIAPRIDKYQQTALRSTARLVETFLKKLLKWQTNGF